MLIYRIENEEGQGCYSRGFGHKCTAEAMETGDAGICHHPGPTEEPKLKSWWLGEGLPKKRQWDWKFSTDSERHLWNCAFADTKQLLDWFPTTGLILMANMAKRHKDSMAVVIYEVPGHKTKRGDAQIMYRRDHATFVERISLEDFVKRI